MRKIPLFLLIMAVMVIGCDNPSSDDNKTRTFEGVLSLDMMMEFDEGTGWVIETPVDPNKDITITVMVGKYVQGSGYFWYEPSWSFITPENENPGVIIYYIPGVSVKVETGQRYLITITGF